MCEKYIHIYIYNLIYVMLHIERQTDIYIYNLIYVMLHIERQTDILYIYYILYYIYIYIYQKARRIKFNYIVIFSTISRYFYFATFRVRGFSPFPSSSFI